ncbi:MAG TPA: alkaline phosphatase family protein [Candidatus Acidoferrum sp.]|nr:alkaline phosphatase family protein [Candidatus Acidoferrum sp.]
MALADCGRTQPQTAPGIVPATAGAFPARGAAQPRLRLVRVARYIRHVVIVVQENRTFDNLFATFPGADGTRYGQMKSGSEEVRIKLKAVPLDGLCDFSHSYGNYLSDYDHGLMDGFNLEGGSKKCPGKAGAAPYQFVSPSQIRPYWDIAHQYVLADHLFTTQGSGSFTAHQDLIAGGTTIGETKTEALVDFPTHFPWGCDAPAGTVTSLLIAGAPPKYESDAGPFPCLKYATLRDLLDAKSVAWKYYSPPEPHGTGALWDAFDAIKAVRDGTEWKTNVTHQPTVIFSDISDGTLPAVSWVVPDDVNSDHPGDASDTGPSWVASIVNAVGESKYWHSTAVIVVWDDWGGFYDHVRPPFFDRWGGLGFRVPMLIVSAYSREGTSKQRGYVSHTQYEFGSILKFVEDVWGLGRLGTTDSRATSIVDCFDFAQSPRTFKRIPSSYSQQYFEHQPPSYEPVDSQ